MQRHIAVLTENKYLFQAIRLDAPDGVEVTRDGEGAELLLVDVDSTEPPACKCVTMSRAYGRAELTLPLPFGKIGELLSGHTSAEPLSVLTDGGYAVLNGEKIKLTETELSLLSSLLARRGAYASRKELLDEVWGGTEDGSVLNVYIHYLREKLEGGGEKIIISSRGEGYAISKKYFGEAEEC